ncbi:hypothetical protein Tcan_09082 [Toxocara canis]|uniref:Uncharacterized protein n=1 Tax=Toxocara canis TaxID=6265 RepID=A0A0B2V9T8_TOXCA|nr:hypothetical protein Tcan_09082 [Toxocara canis]
MVKIDLGDAEPDPELSLEHAPSEQPMVVPTTTLPTTTTETTMPTTTKESMKDAVVNFVGDKARSLTDIAKKQVMEKTGRKHVSVYDLVIATLINTSDIQKRTWVFL